MKLGYAIKVLNKFEVARSPARRHGDLFKQSARPDVCHNYAPLKGMGGWMDGRMDGRIDGWMDGWIDGWVNGWMEEKKREDEKGVPPSCRHDIG